MSIPLSLVFYTLLNVYSVSSSSSLQSWSRVPRSEGLRFELQEKKYGVVEGTGQ